MRRFSAPGSAAERLRCMECKLPEGGAENPTLCAIKKPDFSGFFLFLSFELPVQSKRLLTLSPSLSLPKAPCHCRFFLSYRAKSAFEKLPSISHMLPKIRKRACKAAYIGRLRTLQSCPTFLALFHPVCPPACEPTRCGQRQSFLHSLRRRHLGTVIQMRVDVCRGAEIRVPQPFLNLF